ncbi:N-acetyl-gamma-glutamyl-phosphate reductase [Heliobacterium undosum]|uniref:N-acetyl-gamma-glutamyl-phosphate reductase n=1 Tax=Heliomicrobium undosum TaxID=121734 RepID=A0A845L265_9FIRM|nr:N-acetyl-gamma-glutamyl-phosphate reductase [Heliomicrobium undosum]MZP30652.1 N-acetyl-gamma-glutamyl-phosphate reductase [Heliomicrobium undosum]
MIRAAIVGATGYTGAELVRLLTRHREVELVGLTSRQYADQPYPNVYPHMSGQVDLACQTQDIDNITDTADVVFLALPHGLSVPWVAECVRKGKKVVDLGADFRLRRAAVYEQWYHVTHEAPELLAEAVYGLPELKREQIQKARIVANPGCYPTASLLSVAPLCGQGLIREDRLIIDAKSGASGAGRNANLALIYGEVNENVKAYNVAKHRHNPEIEQEVAERAGLDPDAMAITFTPHLMPMTRGILATVYADLKEGVRPSAEEVRDLYRQFYAGEPFIHIMDEGVWPQTKWSYGSNHAFIGLTVEARTGRIIITTAIDNLVKGASGQAIQNMNILFGLPETTGIEAAGIYP